MRRRDLQVWFVNVCLMFEKLAEEDAPLRNHLDLRLVLPLKKIKMQSYITIS
jgi:hypothetical protein